MEVAQHFNWHTEESELLTLLEYRSARTSFEIQIKNGLYLSEQQLHQKILKMICFIFQLQLMYNIVLVSGIEPSGYTFM